MPLVPPELVRVNATGALITAEVFPEAPVLVNEIGPKAELTVVKAVTGKAMNANHIKNPSKTVARSLAPHDNPTSHVPSSSRNPERARFGP